MKIFEIFKFSGQNSSNRSCHFWNDKLALLQILRNSSLSWQITPDFKLILFKFRLKDPIKIPILSPLEKICHISHVIFQNTSHLKVMLDKHVNSVLGEGMQFLDKCSPLNFNFLDFPLLAWSYSNSSYDFWNLETVLYKFCSIF